MENLMTMSYEVKQSREKSLRNVRAEKKPTQHKPKHLFQVVCEAWFPEWKPDAEVDLVPVEILIEIAFHT